MCLCIWPLHLLSTTHYTCRCLSETCFQSTLWCPTKTIAYNQLMLPSILHLIDEAAEIPYAQNHILLTCCWLETNPFSFISFIKTYMLLFPCVSQLFISGHLTFYCKCWISALGVSSLHVFAYGWSLATCFTFFYGKGKHVFYDSTNTVFLGDFLLISLLLLIWWRCRTNGCNWISIKPVTNHSWIDNKAW